MTCILGTDKNGNRFIACKRGVPDRRYMKDDFADIIPPESPLQIGKNVKHKVYGKGSIVNRAQEWIDIDFPAHGVKRFVIMYINKNIEVIG